MNFNYSAIHYSLKNNCYVQYFFWTYLRSLDTSGCFYVNQAINDLFKTSTFKRKLKTNIFYKFCDNKIILTSKQKLPIKLSKEEYCVGFNEISKFANKTANYSNNHIKGWNNTTIKYLLISIYSSKYENSKPYALELIEQDLGYSISTIQRALKTFGVLRTHSTQTKESNRSYYFNGSTINLSPNYYKMPIGEIKKFKY